MCFCAYIFSEFFDRTHAANLHCVGINDAAQLHSAGIFIAAGKRYLGVVAGAVGKQLDREAARTVGIADLICGSIGCAAAISSSLRSSASRMVLIILILEIMFFIVSASSGSLNSFVASFLSTAISLPELF